MNDVLKKIRELAIVPVVKIMDAKDAVPLGKALTAGDLPVAEITFRTEAAEEATVSRIYNGNHSRIDQVAGENLGHDIADFVLQSDLLPHVASAH